MHSEKPILPAQTHIGAVTLQVADLARSVDFYTDIIGLQVLKQAEQNTLMGVATTPLLDLWEHPAAHPQPDYSTGLYHVAILTPSQADLGRVLLNLSLTQYPVSGFSDHLVSEAIYLNDPDGNGLELYRDRPRDEWVWHGDQLKMANERLDIEGIVASVADRHTPYSGMADGTTIGHIHLRVTDINKTRAFYQDIIGFDVMAGWSSALFMSAGGYHHHIGANTWHSHNAPPPPAEAVGLLSYSVMVPEVDPIGIRLKNANIDFAVADNVLSVDDPSGNRIRFVEI